MVFLRAKAIVIGDSEVGKTAICQMLGSDGGEYPKNYNFTAIADYNTKQVIVPDSNDIVEFFLNDCSGKSMYIDYVKEIWVDADMFCIVFDLANAESFKHASMWLEKVKEVFANKKPLGVLLANKTDLENRRAVPQSSAKQFAESNGLKYFECSAKENSNLLDAFKYLAEEYSKKYKERTNFINNSF